MLKTISAALLALSVIAAPAFAAETAAPAPVSKTAPIIKSEQLPAKVLNANARMGRHHHKHFRAHRHHKHIGLLKVKSPRHIAKRSHAKIAIKHVASVKRG